jgi:hypothetical protein
MSSLTPGYYRKRELVNIFNDRCQLLTGGIFTAEGAEVAERILFPVLVSALSAFSAVKPVLRFGLLLLFWFRRMT